MSEQAKLMIGDREVRETVNAVIMNADLGVTKNDHKELVLRSSLDGKTYWPRHSLSSTVCAKGKNKGKSMAQVSVDRIRRELGRNKDTGLQALEARGEYIGRPITIYLADSESLDADGKPYDDILSFTVGGAGGTIDATEALDGLNIV